MRRRGYNNFSAKEKGGMIVERMSQEDLHRGKEMRAAQMFLDVWWSVGRHLKCPSDTIGQGAGCLILGMKTINEARRETVHSL